MPLPSASTIGIDCRFAMTKSGIGTYTRELVRCLLRRDESWHYVLFVQDIEKHGLGNLPQTNNFQLSTFNFPFYSLGEQRRFPSAIKQSGISLLHSPNFNVPLLCPVPFVATIHDLILHSFPNESSLLKQCAYRMLMKHTIKGAAHLIAVSRFTETELVREYGEIIKEKTSVIYEGVATQFKPQTDPEKQRIRKKYNLPASFILYVGACKEHKNVQTLIDAAIDHPLILVTGGRETTKLNLRDNTRILSIEDRDIPALMGSANVYVQPSLSEGFGLPILEAMACGTPVVMSNRGSLPEIAGGLAILSEPTTEGIGNGIKKALNNRQTTSYQLQALTHARSFSWERAAKETAEIYGSVLKIID